MNPPTLPHPLADAFTWAWQTSASATVLIALVLVVQVAFRRLLAPRWRYALGLLILLRLALPAVPASPLSIFNLAHRPPPPASVKFPTTFPSPEIADAPPVTIDLSNPTIAAALAEAAQLAPAPRHWNLATIAGFIWLAGFLLMLSVAVWRQRKFILELRRWGNVTDPRVLALLADCQARLGVRRRVRLLAATGLGTPALFGWLRPCLLVPADMLQKLADTELRHIFLHELLHLKRGDVLVNWAMILLRALHWFNPAVWLAFRQLRADQEMACDAAVMARLAAAERRAYGHTLIKLLDDFSAAGLCPGVVPFVTNKQVIKRRIVMIARFQPAGRLARLASLVLIAALACFTFTRAADTAVEPAAEPFPMPTPVADEPAPTAQLASAVQNFQVVLKDQDLQIRKLEENLNMLREKLQVVDPDPWNSASIGTLPPSGYAQYSAQKIQAEYELAKEESSLAEFRKLNRSELGFALASSQPDSILTTLSKDSISADTTLAVLKANLGENHPDVKRAELLKTSLDEKIQAQVEAMMRSRENKIRSLLIQNDLLLKKIAEARAADLRNTVDQRPYWEAKAELDRLKRAREVIALRSFQEMVEPNLKKMTAQTTLPTTQPDAVLTVAVDNDGSIHLGNDRASVTLEQLLTTLRSAAARNPKTTLSLRVGKNVPIANLTKVLDAAKEANIQSISLRTAPESDPKSPAPSPSAANTQPNVPSVANVETLEAKVDSLERALKSLDAEIQSREAALKDLQKKDNGVDPNSSAAASILHLQQSLVEAQAQWLKSKAFLDELNRLSRADLAQVLPSAVPDPLLNQLLQDRNTTEARLAALGRRPAQDPEVAELRRVSAKLKSQIDERVTGLVKSVETDVRSANNLINETRAKIDATAKNADLGAWYDQFTRLRGELQKLQGERQSLQGVLENTKKTLAQTAAI